MKKVCFFVLFVTALALSSFTNSGTSRHTAALKKTPPAISWSENEESQLNFSDYSECTGEYIDISGTIHEVWHGVSNNKKSTSVYHVNFQNVKGVGESTGNTYRVLSVYNEKSTYTYTTCTLTEHYVEIIKFNAPGQHNNFYLKLNVSYTYNFCTDEFTVKREKVDSGCH